MVKAGPRCTLPAVSYSPGPGRVLPAAAPPDGLPVKVKAGPPRLGLIPSYSPAGHPVHL
jgi:hypothetical protein